MQRGVFVVLILSVLAGSIVAVKCTRCRPDERYTKCDYTTCIEACNRLGFISCPAMMGCHSGCLCKEGLIRLDWQNVRSQCVKQEDCPRTSS